MKKSQALVLLLTVLPALTGQGMLAQSQLSGYWKFDGNAQDSSGNANHGQQVGAPLYVRSQLGSAIGLNGVTDYVKVASTPSLETWHANRQLTLEAWIYPTRMDRDMFVFGKQGGNCSDELAVWVEPIGGDQGVIGAHVVDDCGTERPRRLYSNPNKPILPNNWYHVALVWDGSAAKHMLYINAVLEDSESLLRDPVNFREELHIGHVRGDPQNLFIFEGLIDETQMWSVARTAAEIKSDMHRERILFYSNRDGNYEVYVMGTDGSNVTRLTNSSANESDASWSPDGRRIVFTSDRHDPRGEIYVMDAADADGDGNGDNLVRLTNHSAQDDQPVWSPDGSKIAFRSTRDGDYEIYVMSATGANPTRFTSSPGQDTPSDWSPDGAKIAFVSERDGNEEIYTMNADGSNQTRLTFNPAIDTRPVWSPDGCKIAFHSNREGGNQDIYVMNADGSNPIRLTTHPAEDLGPDWSSDGTKIVFNSFRDGNREIYVMNTDGSNPVRVTNNPADDPGPRWQPPLLTPAILFYSNRDGNYEVYVMGTDGSNVTRLTNSSANESDASWSPDGRRIVFTSDRHDPRGEIYVMDAADADGDGNGDNLVRLTNHSAQDDQPVWSPDGSKIAFRSTRDGDYEIYVMSATGANPTRFTSSPGQDTPSDWSPDGAKIAFVSERDGNEEIYTMNADGSNQTRLTFNPAIDTRPVWSPDGSRIAFHSNREGGNQDIYVMNADGSNPVRLTTHPAEDLGPDWSSDGTKIVFNSFRDGNREIYVMNADGSNPVRVTNNPADDPGPRWHWRPIIKPPIANAGPDQVVSVGAHCQATVSLDGRASTNPSGDSLTFTWTGTFGVISGVKPTVSLPLGTHIIALTVSDCQGGRATDTVVLRVVDTAPPTIAAPSDVTVMTGPWATACGTVVADAVLGNAAASDNCSAIVTLTRTGVPAGNFFPVGTTMITYTARDGAGNSATATQKVTVLDNTPPVITCPANITVVGNILGSCAAYVNVGDPTVTDNCSAVKVTGIRGDGQALNVPYPLGTTTITWTATDAAGHAVSCQQVVSVANPTPTVTITGPASGAIFAVGTPVNFAGTFTDNPGGTHTALWTFDGLTQPGTINEATSAVTATYTFTAAGVYMVKLTVEDGCGGTGTATTVDGLTAMVVVYDPDGGFVTGGGWINSPAGAYTPNPSLTGKANFGFVSKYQPGATVPTGQTEFQFQVANFNFHSTTYEWLVVGGPRAQYKGTGTVNGGGSYGFLLTAIDGQINGGGGAEKFRIKIWDKNNGDGIVYDNQMGTTDNADPTTVLGGGSIVIHP